MKNDAAWLRAMANTLRRIGASRVCIGNELTVMGCTDLAAATDELALWIEADDARAVKEFAAEAQTAPAALVTQPGVGARR